MIFAVTRNLLSFHSDTSTYLKCMLHTFTLEEAQFQEDNLNVEDTDPGIYYETLVSDTIDKCDFCGLELAQLIWFE